MNRQIQKSWEAAFSEAREWIGPNERPTTPNGLVSVLDCRAQTPLATLVCLHRLLGELFGPRLVSDFPRKLEQWSAERIDVLDTRGWQPMTRRWLILDPSTHRDQGAATIPLARSQQPLAGLEVLAAVIQNPRLLRLGQGMILGAIQTQTRNGQEHRATTWTIHRSTTMVDRRQLVHLSSVSSDWHRLNFTIPTVRR